ncbi:MAG: phenylalanine--tRNA ligase subunit beta [Muribaculaceae bacterium]|nr:phenylalanine--tRNA ligase subunit beta [Muribaculaceae bacterium]
MNISYNWLKQYVDFNLTPDEVAAALTSIGLETGSVEKVESIRGGLQGIVVGKVLSCSEHPDSDHLHITTVDLGDGQPVQIVCGAPNVAAGQTVVVATVGTVLYGEGDESFKIKKSKIRGVESFGMICAEDEIGVGKSHDGIMVLPDNVAAGTPAAEYFDLKDDYVLEVDLTPNRIDAASHFGVARDLAAWLRCHKGQGCATRPDVSAFTTDDSLPAVQVSYVDAERCIRYSGVTIRGVKVTESPQWLKDALTAIGQRPINNVVDITNYVLHAFGHPLHAFDLARLSGDSIEVQTVAAGTEFVTLDGVTRKLDSADLMICSGGVPRCIAGVFGGLDSGVTEATTDLFLESACFNATSVRKTARRHGLNTDASFRYERGVDPNGCIYALRYAALLIQQIAGGTCAGPVVDIYPRTVESYRVQLSQRQITALLGQEIPAETVRSILGSLEIEIAGEDSEGMMDLRVPTYRVDVQRPCDVIEDLLRIYGYNNIATPQALHASLSFKTPTDAADDLRRLIAEQLTAAGYNEILNNSLTAENYYSELTTYPAAACVRLLNPLSQELNVMRQTLLFGGLESLAHNINRRLPDLALYEFGNVYRYDAGRESTADRPLAPYSQSARLAMWLSGDSRQGNWSRPAEEASFYDLRAAVDNVLARLGLGAQMLQFAPASDMADIFGAALSVSSRKGGKLLGHLGIVRDDLCRRCEIKQPVIYAEFDWDALVSLSLRSKVSYTPLPKTHPVKRDLSLLLDSSVTMADVERVVAESERRLLRSVSLFDVYEGKNLPEGKKSYAITILLQDDEKTLQDKHIDQVMNRIISNLKTKLGAELR